VVRDNRCLALEAKIASLLEVMAFVQKGAREAGLPAVRASELDLLIEEIFVNVCAYAYPDSAPGLVTVTYWVPAPGELKVEVADQGVEFNPLMAEPADVSLDLEHRPIGGLGIFLVRKLAASLTYRREDGWNRLTFGISAGSG
jgi:anti-sigma regulatory factor (Ser/Thr protein kinase)